MLRSLSIFLCLLAWIECTHAWPTNDFTYCPCVINPVTNACAYQTFGANCSDACPVTPPVHSICQTITNSAGLTCQNGYIWNTASASCVLPQSMQYQPKTPLHTVNMSTIVPFYPQSGRYSYTRYYENMYQADVDTTVFGMQIYMTPGSYIKQAYYGFNYWYGTSGSIYSSKPVTLINSATTNYIQSVNESAVYNIYLSEPFIVSRHRRWSFGVQADVAGTMPFIKRTSTPIGNALRYMATMVSTSSPLATMSIQPLKPSNGEQYPINVIHRPGCPCKGNNTIQALDWTFLTGGGQLNMNPGVVQAVYVNVTLKYNTSLTRIVVGVYGTDLLSWNSTFNYFVEEVLTDGSVLVLRNESTKYTVMSGRPATTPGATGWMRIPLYHNPVAINAGKQYRIGYWYIANTIAKGAIGTVTPSTYNTVLHSRRFATFSGICPSATLCSTSQLPAVYTSAIAFSGNQEYAIDAEFDCPVPQSWNGYKCDSNTCTLPYSFSDPTYVKSLDTCVMGSIASDAYCSIPCMAGTSSNSLASTTITCTADGTWDTLPECRKNRPCTANYLPNQVDTLDVYNNATSLTINMPDGASALLNCPYGYENNYLSVFMFVECHDATFTAMGDLPDLSYGAVGGLDQALCVPARCRLYDPTGFVPNGNSGTCNGLMDSNTTCSFACNPGYQLIGSPMTCNMGSYFPASYNQTCVPIPVVSSSSSTGGYRPVSSSSSSTGVAFKVSSSSTGGVQTVVTLSSSTGAAQSSTATGNTPVLSSTGSSPILSSTSVAYAMFSSSASPVLSSSAAVVQSSSTGSVYQLSSTATDVPISSTGVDVQSSTGVFVSSTGSVYSPPSPPIVNETVVIDFGDSHLDPNSPSYVQTDTSSSSSSSIWDATTIGVVASSVGVSAIGIGVVVVPRIIAALHSANALGGTRGRYNPSKKRHY